MVHLSEFVIVCVLFIGNNAFAFKFPNDIQKCNVGDTACIIESANKVLEGFSKEGHNGINLLPLDPLYIPKLTILQGEASPVNVDLSFKDNYMYGLKNARFHKIDGFQENPNGKYEFRYKAPRIDLAGPYKISGKVLILPIQGEGQSNISIVDPDITFKFTGKTITKNGKEYLTPENPRLTFTMSRIIYKLDNLYKGDKALGDSTNLFLNENWKEIFPEVSGSIFDAFSQIIGNVVRQVFAKVPYKELFKEKP